MRVGSENRQIKAKLGQGNSLYPALTDDLVNDAGNRCGGIDDNAVLRNVFVRSMQARNEFPFCLQPAPLILRSLLEAPVQRLAVDV